MTKSLLVNSKKKFDRFKCFFGRVQPLNVIFMPRKHPLTSFIFMLRDKNGGHPRKMHSDVKSAHEYEAFIGKQNYQLSGPMLILVIPPGMLVYHKTAKSCFTCPHHQTKRGEKVLLLLE